MPNPQSPILTTTRKDDSTFRTLLENGFFCTTEEVKTYLKYFCF
jgi:hypothetical protein